MSETGRKVHPPPKPSENVAGTWTMLSANLEAFIEAWEEAVEPPPLHAFLPPAETPTRRLVLIELIKLDLEYRWKQNTPKCLEEYFRDFPDLGDDPPPDLIYEEYHIRSAAGEAV